MLIQKCVRSRPSFHAGFIEWMPKSLGDEMRANGVRSWPDVKRLLDI
jgi:hypothetical protein